MNSMQSIYYPCFMMLILTFIVLGIMFKRRVSALRSKTIKMSHFKIYDKMDSAPEAMLVASRNFSNLFEMPVLFYMVCLFGLVTMKITLSFYLCAWGYVVLRYLHSYVHLTSNNIMLRMNLYALSVLTLLAMAIELAFRLS